MRRIAPLLVFVLLALAHAAPSLDRPDCFTAAEHLAEDIPETAALLAEDLAEDVARVVEAATGRAARDAAAALECRGAVAVVGRTLLGVAQHLVGVRHLLEHLLGLLVAGVLVRVVLHRLFAVGLLQGVGIDALLDAEQFVVVVLGHGQEAAGLAGPLETMTEAGRRRRPLSE